MIVARAVADDLDAIESLEREGFDHARWSRDAWRSELEGADRYVLVVRSPEGVVGVATFQTVADSADLHRVVVRTDHRGQGIARRLITAGMEWAEAMGAERMLLEVEWDNAAALRLYDRFGFVPLARREDYYGAGRHAVVMSHPLGRAAAIAAGQGEMES